MSRPNYRMQEVLEHIETASKGGWISAQVPSHWENTANISIILGYSILSADGRRLTDAGRRQLRNLSVTGRKTLTKLLRSPKWTVIKAHMYNSVLFDLAQAKLVHAREIAHGLYACKLTTLGRSCIEPPAMPPRTHIIRLVYASLSTQRQYSVHFSGSDLDAENQMARLTNTNFWQEAPLKSARVRRLTDGVEIASTR